LQTAISLTSRCFALERAHVDFVLELGQRQLPPAADMPPRMLTAALCRFCCKSPFALVVKNFPGFRRLTINSLTTSVSAVACRHVRQRLRGKPPSGHRKHHRSRSHSHLRACNYGRSAHVDGESASELLRLCAESARDDISGSTAWARNPRALAGRAVPQVHERALWPCDPPSGPSGGTEGLTAKLGGRDPAGEKRPQPGSMERRHKQMCST
jgi:hypothetical protein